MKPILVDSSFLVALFNPSDRLAAPAARYLETHKHPLATVSAAVVETCFFLSAHLKADMLAWIRRGGISAVEVPVSAYAQIELTLRKYADHDLDFVDAALVWLGNESGALRLLTADETDFRLLRLKGGRQFDLIAWY